MKQYLLKRSLVLNILKLLFQIIMQKKVAENGRVVQKIETGIFDETTERMA